MINKDKLSTIINIDKHPIKDSSYRSECRRKLDNDGVLVLEDFLLKDTIKKLESLYRKDKYTHKRIWQVGMIMYVRLKVLKEKKKEHFKLSERYFKHLGKRTKIKDKDDRKKFKFKF